MKKIKWTLLLTLLSISIFIVLSSCDFNKISNPADKIEIRVKNIARETFVSFEILDAKTNEQINYPIEVEVAGDDKNYVINEVNEPTNFFTVEYGVLLFAIADGVMPSIDEPIRLNIILKSDKYISTSQPIMVTKDGMSTFSTVMTNVENTPDGVVTNTENAGETDNTGGMTESVEVSSGEDSESGAEASIAIEEGTKLQDAEGNVLTGAVEATVTYFNPLNEESLSAFPGGFSVETDDGDDGEFTTAGFVAVDMTVGGTDVEHFDGNVEIKIDVPEGTINPETGQPVKAGDKIPVYSYDEDNGSWNYEGEVTVPTPDGLGKSDGSHKVTISNVKHLSYWNLDWFEGYSGNNYCQVGSTLEFVSTTGNFNYVYARVFDQDTDNAVSWWAKKTIYNNDASKTLQYVQRNKPVTIRVYDFNSNEVIGSLNVDDLCASETFQVLFTPIPVIPPVNVTINVQIQCDGSAVIPNGLPIYAKKFNSSRWNYLGTLGNGIISGEFESDAFFDFAIMFDNQWYFTKDYADDILNYAAEAGYTMQKNSYGYLQMEATNTNISVILKDVKSICDEL